MRGKSRIFKPGGFPGMPPAGNFWYFPVKCEIWPEIVQNHTFLCEENHVFSDPGDFPGSHPGNFGGVVGHPPIGGGADTPTPGGGKGLRFRGRNFWQKWSKIKNSGPQILSAATGFIILILEVKNRQKRGVFSKSRVLFLLVKINSLLLETAVKKSEILEFLMWKFVKNCE